MSATSAYCAQCGNYTEPAYRLIKGQYVPACNRCGFHPIALIEDPEPLRSRLWRFLLRRH